jgi:predicted transcriptional regulator YdeE
MSIIISDRDAFAILGVMVETNLATAGQDITLLEKHYTELAPRIKAHRDAQGHYGLMWYTQDHRYCYLLGVSVDQTVSESEPLLCRQIPAARYAVMNVSGDESVFAAWGEFFEKILPSEGWAPDYEHGQFFEYYPDDGSFYCQLWTPVKPIP